MHASLGVALVCASVAFTIATLHLYGALTHRDVADGSAVPRTDAPATLNARQREALAAAGSSMFCRGGGHEDRSCIVHNLCYVAARNELVFLHSARSVIAGVRPGTSPLVEVTAVVDHNVQHLTLTDLPAGAIKQQNVVMVPGETVVFRRFNPSNVMHAFHDDLLPLYATLQELSTTGAVDRTVRIAALDAWGRGGFDELISLLSNQVGDM